MSTEFKSRANKQGNEMSSITVVIPVSNLIKFQKKNKKERKKTIIQLSIKQILTYSIKRCTGLPLEVRFEYPL